MGSPDLITFWGSSLPPPASRLTAERFGGAGGWLTTCGGELEILDMMLHSDVAMYSYGLLSQPLPNETHRLRNIPHLQKSGMHFVLCRCPTPRPTRSCHPKSRLPAGGGRQPTRRDAWMSLIELLQRFNKLPGLLTLGFRKALPGIPDQQHLQETRLGKSPPDRTK